MTFQINDYGIVSPVGYTGKQTIVGPRGESGDIGDSVNLGNVSGAIDVSEHVFAAQTFRLVATGNLTLAASGLPAAPADKTGSITLRIQQDSGGLKTLTLASDIKTAVGVDPILSTSAGAVDLLHLFWTGAEWVALASAWAVS